MERTNCDDKAYFRITNELLSFVHVVTPSLHRREVLQICGFVKIQLNSREKGGGGERGGSIQAQSFNNFEIKTARLSGNAAKLTGL